MPFEVQMMGVFAPTWDFIERRYALLNWTGTAWIMKAASARAIAGSVVAVTHRGNFTSERNVG